MSGNKWESCDESSASAQSNTVLVRRWCIALAILDTVPYRTTCTSAQRHTLSIQHHHIRPCCETFLRLYGRSCAFPYSPIGRDFPCIACDSERIFTFRCAAAGSATSLSLPWITTSCDGNDWGLGASTIGLSMPVPPGASAVCWLSTKLRNLAGKHHAWRHVVVASI